MHECGAVFMEELVGSVKEAYRFGGEKLIGSVEGLLIQKQSSFCADKGVFSEDEGVSGVYWRRG